MFDNLKKEIDLIIAQPIREDRRLVLDELITAIQSRGAVNGKVNLNFICTHNSRRSIFAQVWAQVAARYFAINNVVCFSGGTVETAVYSMVVETLAHAGMKVDLLSSHENNIYSIRYDEFSHPIIAFSKQYNHFFNPSSSFIAIMTCTQADGDCPLVMGAADRIALPYEDPKRYDDTVNAASVYHSKSREIAAEMFYVFSSIKDMIEK